MLSNTRARRVVAALGAATLGVTLFAAPASAAGMWANCSGSLLRNGLGQSAPKISCTTMSASTQARMKLDCTAAPDVSTGWVRAYGSSTGGFCLFGSRGYSAELRKA